MNYIKTFEYIFIIIYIRDLLKSYYILFSIIEKITYLQYVIFLVLF